MFKTQNIRLLSNFKTLCFNAFKMHDTLLMKTLGDLSTTSFKMFCFYFQLMLCPKIVT